MTRTRAGRIAATVPNWSEPVTVEYAFATSIITSQDGHEQREARRVEPRVSLDFNTLLDRAGMEQFTADISRDVLEPFVVICPWRQSVSRNAKSPGVSFIEIETAPAWIVPGAWLVIETATTREAVTVASVTGPVVALVDVLVHAVPLGARIYGALLARAGDEVDFSARTATVFEGRIVFTGVPGSNPVGVDPAAYGNFDTYEARPVFARPPNWRENVSVKLQHLREILDSGRGQTSLYTPVKRMVRTEKLGFLFKTQAEVDDLLALFMYLMGKRGSFWAPTWTRDIVPETTATAGSAALTVPGLDFGLSYASSDTHNVVMVRWPGGTYQVNRIASYAVSGGDTLLSMADAWVADVAPDLMVCWCPLVRLASDTLSVEWVTDQVARVKLTVESVRNEEPV